MWKRLSMLWALVRGDARTLWFAVRHPGAPRWLKAGVVLLALYLVSPIDLIPDLAVPFIGLIDDLVLIPLAIRWMLRRLPEQVRRDAQQRATSSRPARAR
ncbi:YkvA family protein [Quisquiliibacterium transsilvanicum]|uniref:Uncharacterized membrane protein YkvA (DUF1232 family) n=1 Tax=Quisquiliibacterium transsilvanicum TaxID=1549638 RepID=A0A7W8HHY4_9BURK|nr:YkvA family protein [Quisquiliibacterium transsilvanicum]MBB5272389.1 uncharacterized membrane protein YkvA (DUF1232 family) [Quisquiliibacterium transsilvanicum]